MELDSRCRRLIDGQWSSIRGRWSPKKLQLLPTMFAVAATTVSSFLWPVVAPAAAAVWFCQPRHRRREPRWRNHAQVAPPWQEAKRGGA